MSETHPAAGAAGRPTAAHTPGHELLPPRLLPTLYFGWAHLCLAAACAVAALHAERVAAIFYDPAAVTAVHLITLGWLTSTILGALYIVCPLAMRTPLPAGRTDYLAFALVLLGTLGAVGHFLIERYSGAGWSAAPLLVGIALVGWRVVRALRHAPIQAAIRLHVTLAFCNILGAGALGLLLAFDNDLGFMPGNVIANLSAHAHLASVGWVAMMILGVGYRMLPMMLPSAMPKGSILAGGAILLEVGTLGLFVSLPGGRLAATAEGAISPVWRAGVCASALLIVAGLGVFLAQVRWMAHHRRPAPAARPRPDFHVWHVRQALVYLAVAALIGFVLLGTPVSDYTLGPAGAYGAAGLVGFLAQMVIGVEATLLPMFAGIHAIARNSTASRNAAAAEPGAAPGDAPLPAVVSPHRMAHRGVAAATFILWTAGTPLLTLGIGFGSPAAVKTGAWLLFAAALLGALNAARILRFAFIDGGGAPPGT